MSFTSLVRRALIAAGIAAIAPPALVAQQGGVIAGQVTDAATHAPIPSAQVQIVGTVRGAVTGNDGRYRIAGVAPGTYTVRVLRIGYAAENRQVTVGQGATANADVTLRAVAVSLEQVVTTATGETEERRVQGNAVSVMQPAPEQLATAQTPSQLLTGRIPGVDVQTSGGTVGSGSRIRIRGANSLSLSNEPIIIIDGVRFNNAVGVSDVSGASTIGVGGQVPSRFNDINPEDIERIEVLKGPAAAALYGTAAASGVIQITTKRGRNARTRFNTFVEGGSLRNAAVFPLNYAQIGRTTAGARTTSCTLASQALAQCTPIADSLVAYSPLVSASPFMNGYRTAFGAGAQGGSDVLTYYLSGNYDRQQGVFQASNDQRAGARANLSTQLRNNWTVQVGSSYLADFLRLPQNDNNTLGIVSTGLLGRAFDDSVAGKPCASGICGRGYLSGLRPELTQAGIITRQNVQRFQNSINTQYQPFGWLRAVGVFGLDYLNRWDNELVIPNIVPFGSLLQGNRTSNPYNIYTYTANTSLEARWSPFASFTTTTTGGFQFNKDLVRGTRAFGANLLGGTGSLQGTTARFSVGETNTDNKTLGLLISERLAWRDRVFITGALRNDKNSAFGVNFGSVTYPSIQASWVLSDESFFPQNRFVNLFRLRAADGRSGRQPTFRDAITYFNAQTVTVGATDVPGIVVGGTGNPNLRPEISREVEFGADMGFFGQRLGLEVTRYDKKTKDILVAVPLPPSLGLTASQFQNLGAMRNRGWELSANARVVDLQPVKFDLGVTANTNQNKILTLGRLPSGDTLPDVVFGNQRQRRGFPAGSYFLRAMTYSDANGDGLISRNEVTVDPLYSYFGSPFPTRQMSLTPTLTLFQRFRVSALFDRKSGYKLFNNTRRFRCSFGNCPEAFVPGTSLADQAAVVAISLGTDAGFVEDASFTKLRELSFSVSAPDRVARALRTQALELIVAGRNLKTWTKYRGLDPEINSTPGAIFSTSDFLTLPPLRMWTARLNLTF